MKTVEIAEAAEPLGQPVALAEPLPARAPELEVTAESAPQIEVQAAPERWSPPAKSWLTRGLIALLLVGAIAAILYAWQLPPFGGRYEKTDNAYVRGQTTVISPEVSGYVSLVTVKDYQDVGAGDVLVRIEDSIYSARVAQARANVLTQIANLQNSDQAQKSKEASTLAQDAGIASAQAMLSRVQADWNRLEPLVKQGWATRAQEDQTRAALLSAQAQVSQANAARQIGTQDVRTVIVGRSGLSASVEAAKAQVRLAEVDLGHTVIRAPVSGQLGEVSVRQGQYVTAGTQLMFLVPKTFWITANYKEAQTRNMKVGDEASFTVDALGDKRLKGHVENLAPAAGSEFAVLRPDNATGNFVKVAQRIAVRIRIDPDQPLVSRLRPGMSVVARIRTDDR
ncbi:MAG: HlyD family secretion protein [Sphingomicrobium sp.]